MASGSRTGTACIDGVAVGVAQLRVEHLVEHLVETVRSHGPRPDHRWTTTDQSGHFHGYDQTADVTDHYPTLDPRTREVPCNGTCVDGCEGYSVVEYVCRICVQQVSPGLLLGEYEVHLPLPSTWQVRVGPGSWTPTSTGPVSVRFEPTTHGVVFFGVAAVSQLDAGNGGATVTLVGVGPLGRTDWLAAVVA